MAAPASTPGVLIPSATAGGHAGIVSRGVALAIDAALVQGGLLLIFALLSLIGSLVGGPHLGSTGQVVLAAVWLFLTAAYFVVGWAAAGQTLGMEAMHVVVVCADGRPPGFGRCIVRVLWLGLCIIPFFLGFATVLFDGRRRGVHDMVSGTVVVYVAAEPGPGFTPPEPGSSPPVP